MPTALTADAAAGAAARRGQSAGLPAMAARWSGVLPPPRVHAFTPSGYCMSNFSTMALSDLGVRGDNGHGSRLESLLLRLSVARAVAPAARGHVEGQRAVARLRHDGFAVR